MLNRKKKIIDTLHEYENFCQFLESIVSPSFYKTSSYMFNDTCYIEDSEYNFIFLWKDPNGNIYYGLNLFDSTPYKTSIAKFPSVVKEHLKLPHRVVVTHDSLKHLNTQKSLNTSIYRINQEKNKIYGKIVTHNINQHQNQQIKQVQLENEKINTGYLETSNLEAQADENGVFSILPPEATSPALQTSFVPVLLDQNGNLVAKWVGDGYLDKLYRKLYYNTHTNQFIDIQSNVIVFFKLFQNNYSNIFTDSTGLYFTHDQLPSTDLKLSQINPNQPFGIVNMVQYQQNFSYLNEKQKIDQQLLDIENNTSYIYIEQIPTVFKTVFEPIQKSLFFLGKNNQLYKNSYIPSTYMVNPEFFPLGNIFDSIILRFILAMTKYNLNKAIDIFTWLATSFITLQKNKIALVLCSSNDIFINLFYKTIVEPLFNEEYCEEINNDSLNTKKIGTMLNNKVIYHFKDVADRTFQNAPIANLSENVIHCEEGNINNKKINLKGNLLISSTSKHIPMITSRIPSVLVDVNNDIQGLCDELSSLNKFASDKYSLGELLKNELPAFAAILHRINLTALPISYSSYNQYNIYKSEEEEMFDDSIVDGDAEPIEVFWLALATKDIEKFRFLDKLHLEKLQNDYADDRILGINLEHYYKGLFGNASKLSNRKILKLSKEKNILDKYVKKKTIGSDIYYYIDLKFLED